MSGPTGDKPVSDVVFELREVVAAAKAEYVRMVRLAEDNQRKTIRDANATLNRLCDYYKPLAVELASNSAMFKVPVNRHGKPLTHDDVDIDHVGVTLTWYGDSRDGNDTDDDVFVATWAELEQYDKFINATKAP